MFLAIDVGNSNIHLGLFKELSKRTVPELIETFTIPANKTILNRFLSFIEKQNQISGIILSDASGATAISKNRAFSLIKKSKHFMLLTPDTNCGLKINYFPKSSLGTDRIANCVGAYTIYKKDCLVVDFGSATTYNVVTKHGEFLGGVITPGIINAYQSLPQHLIQSKSVLSGLKPNVLATSTSQSVKSGLYYYVIGTYKKIKQEMEVKLNRKLYAVATGGGVNLIPNIKNIFDNIDANLTLKGLGIIYKHINLAIG